MSSYYRFSREDEARLIEQVSNYPLIYLTFRASDFALGSRNKIWEEIAQNLNIPEVSVTDCKTRWRSLRDLYKRKRKQLGLASLEERKKIVKWEHMDRMGFVDKRPTRIRHNSKKKGKIDIKHIVLKTTPVLQSLYPLNDSTGTEIKVKQEYSEEIVIDSDNSMPSTSNSLPPAGETDDNDETLTPAKKHIMTFFKSMGQTVLNFPPDLAAEAKIKVAQVINELEMRSLNSELSEISQRLIFNMKEIGK